MIAACTNADELVLVSVQGPFPSFGSVAFNWYGVARPAAVNGASGTTIVQVWILREQPPRRSHESKNKKRNNGGGRYDDS